MVVSKDIQSIYYVMEGKCCIEIRFLFFWLGYVKLNIKTNLRKTKPTQPIILLFTDPASEKNSVLKYILTYFTAAFRNK